MQDKFDHARDGLCRETKNYRLDSPYEVANYNSRLMMEESVWDIDDYINSMEGPSAESDPLTMSECAEAAEEGISKRIRCEALCMGNMAAVEAETVAKMITERFLASSRVLGDAEVPRFRSLQLLTPTEAAKIFGPIDGGNKAIPLVYADLAYSKSEENSAVELIMQVGSELDLGYRGLAIFDLINHIAYNSAYNQLRTIEQLGYIVSVFPRKTAGNTWAMSALVQGSVSTPEILEERIQSWLEIFREELYAMSPEDIAAEGRAVAAQVLEADTKLSQEVSSFWGDILNTECLTESLRTPEFDRLKKLAKELVVVEYVVNDGSIRSTDGDEEDSLRLTADVLKHRVVTFFDKHFATTSPDRRVMSARVYSQKFINEFETARGQPGVVSNFDDMRHLKQFLSTWPTAPYWRVDKSTVTNKNGNDDSTIAFCKDL